MTASNRGLFVWYDHLARDVPAAIAFYSEVVGWKTEPFGPDYQMLVASQGPLGGVMGVGEDPAAGTPHWTAYVRVDDVDAAARRAQELGGRVCHAPADIPTVGRFAVLADPHGASISIFRPLKQDMPPRDLSKDGEFCWNELATPDAAAALRFYGDLFGWTVLEEMDMGPDGTYRIFGLNGVRLGGMYGPPPGKPVTPAWLYYASTSDLDAALARARRAGAQVLSGPMDVPGGRIAQLRDPQGAAFALHQAAR